MGLTAGAHLGHYDVLNRIGAGGMGEVYRARDAKLGREVALKILPDAFATDRDRLARFEREARTLASLNHPNIAQVYGFEEQDSIRAIVMELADGSTLAEVVRARRTMSGDGARGAIGLPLSESLAIAGQIAAALDAAHEAGVIHRDLKPANIKVRDDGTVKVLDFGLAKAIEPAGASAGNAADSPTLTARATELGVILGTAAYMAPEQAKGKPVDRRADVWAFGAVLFEMLSGRPAFDGEDVSDVLASVLKMEPDWTSLPGDLPLPVTRRLRRCLEKDPKRRLRDLSEGMHQLDEGLSAVSVAASAPTVTTSVGSGERSAQRTVPAPLWRRAAPILATAGITALTMTLYGTLRRPPNVPAESIRFTHVALSATPVFASPTFPGPEKRRRLQRPRGSTSTRACPRTRRASRSISGTRRTTSGSGTNAGRSIGSRPARGLNSTRTGCLLTDGRWFSARTSAPGIAC